jgi:ankyrin repeat protein
LYAFFTNIFVAYLSTFFSQDGGTVLIVAAHNGHLDVVALLLDRGANIEAARNVNNEINVVVVDIVACNKTHTF